MPEHFQSFPSSFLGEEDKSKFLIQDPFGLREVIQPVVSISQIEDKITGLGTCFQVSPWSWLTAQHVVVDNSGESFPHQEVGAVGFSHGFIYGAERFTTTDHFGEVVEIRTAKKENAAAPSLLPGPTNPPILVDLAFLRVNTTNLKKPRLVSPLPLSSSQPKLGDEVIGIGFPILGSSFDSESAIMKFSERMYGASGIITALYPNGHSTSRPWPTIQIEGNWESGMSGGPVVDLQGRIVGVISSSFAPTKEHPGIGFAVDLTQIPTAQFLPELDPSNPGWSLGWATFKTGKMTRFFETEAKAYSYMKVTQSDELMRVSHCPKTDDWMKL